MSSTNELLHQADTLQQPPLIERNDNRSWKAFSILLIIVNLLYLGAYFIVLRFFLVLLALSPLLTPIAIVDFITVRSYIKKQPPPWKAFIILLLFINVLYFSLVNWELSQSGAGMAAPVYAVIAIVLLLIDSLAILSYIHIHLTHRKAKVILYTILVSVIFGLIVFGVLVLTAYF